jgi:hypothetical protein
MRLSSSASVGAFARGHSSPTAAGRTSTATSGGGMTGGSASFPSVVQSAAAQRQRDANGGAPTGPSPFAPPQGRLPWTADPSSTLFTPLPIAAAATALSGNGLRFQSANSSRAARRAAKAEPPKFCQSTPEQLAQEHGRVGFAAMEAMARQLIIREEGAMRDADFRAHAQAFKECVAAVKREVQEATHPEYRLAAAAATPAALSSAGAPVGTSKASVRAADSAGHAIRPSSASRLRAGAGSAIRSK